MPSGKSMDADVADAIRLTVMCQEFHVLPNVGGLLDQDSYHVWLMEKVVTAQREKEELDHKRAESQAKTRR